MKKIRSKCLQAQDDTRALIAQKIPGPVGLTSSSSEFLNRASARNLISATVQKEADGAIARKALDALGKNILVRDCFIGCPGVYLTRQGWLIGSYRNLCDFREKLKKDQIGLKDFEKLRIATLQKGLFEKFWNNHRNRLRSECQKLDNVVLLRFGCRPEDILSIDEFITVVGNKTQTKLNKRITSQEQHNLLETQKINFAEKNGKLSLKVNVTAQPAFRQKCANFA